MIQCVVDPKHQQVYVHASGNSFLGNCNAKCSCGFLVLISIRSGSFSDTCLLHNTNPSHFNSNSILPIGLDLARCTETYSNLEIYIWGVGPSVIEPIWASLLTIQQAALVEQNPRKWARPGCTIPQLLWPSSAVLADAKRIRCFAASDVGGQAQDMGNSCPPWVYACIVEVVWLCEHHLLFQSNAEEWCALIIGSIFQ